MIKKDILMLVLLLGSSAVGMSQKKIHQYFQCTDYKIEKENKETSKSAIFYFEADSVLDKIEIYPCYTAANVNYGWLIVDKEDVPVFGEYLNDLRLLLSKYTSYIKIARDNGIGDYRKHLDSLVVNNPTYGGYFCLGDRINYERYRINGKIRMAHYFFVHNGRMSLEIIAVDTKGTKVKGTSDHDFFYTDYATNPRTYLSFTSPDQLQSFIDAIDIEKAYKELRTPNYQYKNKDDLFK